MVNSFLYQLHASALSNVNGDTIFILEIRAVLYKH